MELENLKDLIQSNNFNSPLLICKYTGNGDFIFHQYLNEYINNSDLDVEYIEDLSQVNYNSSLFYDDSKIIKILDVDKLDDVCIPKNEKLWIKTKKISTSVKKKYSDYIVEIPKLESWQIKDYVSTKCKDLPEKEVDYILKIYKDNIYRIDNEINKLSGFSNISSVYERVKSQLFIDSTDYNIFDLTNSLVKRDIESIKSILKSIDNMDINPFALLTSLQNNFKKVIDIQLNPKNTAESLGINSKQFWAIKKYSCGHYNKDELCKIYHFINQCIYDLKIGVINTDISIKYIIIKIVNI